MTQAWQKRESERQEFLESLHKEIAAAIEASTAASYYEGQRVFAVALLEFLSEKVAELKPLGSHLHVMIALDNPFRGFILKELWPKVEAFGRTDPERTALLGKILEWSAKAIVLEAQGPLTKQELENPEALFGGHMATDEV